ncbi:hypothetical protein AAMO2058_000249400 [Amorphochlora amoebiformis]
MHSRYKAQTLTPNPPSLPGTNIHRNPYTRKPHWATSSGRTTKQIQEDCAEKVILSTNRLRGCNFPFRRKELGALVGGSDLGPRAPVFMPPRSAVRSWAHHFLTFRRLCLPQNPWPETNMQDAVRSHPEGFLSPHQCPTKAPMQNVSRKLGFLDDKVLIRQDTHLKNAGNEKRSAAAPLPPRPRPRETVRPAECKRRVHASQKSATRRRKRVLLLSPAPSAFSEDQNNYEGPKSGVAEALKTAALVPTAGVERVTVDEVKAAASNSMAVFGRVLSHRGTNMMRRIGKPSVLLDFEQKKLDQYTGWVCAGWIILKFERDGSKPSLARAPVILSFARPNQAEVMVCTRRGVAGIPTTVKEVMLVGSLKRIREFRPRVKALQLNLQITTDECVARNIFFPPTVPPMDQLKARRDRTEMQRKRLRDKVQEDAKLLLGLFSMGTREQHTSKRQKV